MKSYLTTANRIKEMYRSCLCVGGSTSTRPIMPPVNEGIGAFAGSIPQPLRCILHHSRGRFLSRLAIGWV